MTEQFLPQGGTPQPQRRATYATPDAAGTQGHGAPSVDAAPATNSQPQFSQFAAGRLRPSVSAESTSAEPVGQYGTPVVGGPIGGQPMTGASVNRTRTGVAPGAGVGQVGTGPTVGAQQAAAGGASPMTQALGSAGLENDYSWAQATAAQTFQREIAPSPFQRAEPATPAANRERLQPVAPTTLLVGDLQYPVASLLQQLLPPLR